MTEIDVPKILIFDASPSGLYMRKSEDAVTSVGAAAISEPIQGLAVERLCSEPFDAVIAAPGDHAKGNYDGRTLLEVVQRLELPRAVLSTKNRNEFVRLQQGSPDVLINRMLTNQVSDRLQEWLLGSSGIFRPKS